jgi:DNA primase
MGEELSIERRIREAESRWPGLHFKKKTRDEAASSCPFCRQGRDRFVVFSDGGYWCRQCNKSGWIDENDTEPLSREELLEMRVRRLERKQEEHERRISKLEHLQQTRPDLRYYRNLTDQALQYWQGEGIYESAVDKFHLGFCRSCPTYTPSPSYTIPVYSYGGELVNVRHRLVHPNGGKYRPEMAGLGTTLFNASTLQDPRRRVLILEGEKKTVVYDQHGFASVGLMGKSFKWRRDWFDWLDGHGEIIIALDPDAEESAWRLGEIFARQGFDNVRVARFPVKPDDAIVQYGAQLEDIKHILGNAAPIRGR